jgi:NAD(P)-dependent dehydrogenase (short-subunit alcohol dehydrogenase family)
MTAQHGVTTQHSPFDLSHRSVLITGGATGIGLAMTRALASAGATVMVTARRQQVLREAADALNADPGVAGRVLWRAVDLTSRESVKALSQAALEELDGVDVFIGNAGAEVQQPIEAVTDDAIDQQIRVNLTANIELTRDLLPHMRRQRWGRFIYCSSAASMAGSAGDMMSVYGAAKSGINGFMRYVAAEAGRDGISANSLILGMYLTEMVEAHLSGEAARHQFLVEVPAMTAIGRPGMPHEVGGLIQLLASDAGSYITGASLAIDGGMTATLRPNPVSEPVELAAVGHDA